MIALALVTISFCLRLFVRLVLHLVWSALLLDGTLFMGLVCAVPDFIDQAFCPFAEACSLWPLVTNRA